MTQTDASIDPDPYQPQFSSLCNLTSFVVNSSEMINIFWELTPSEASVLCSLLTSGSEISRLVVPFELPPGTGAQLGSAILAAASTIRALLLGNYDAPACDPAPELFRMLTASANPTLEKLHMENLLIDDSSKCASFDKFAALRYLVVFANKPCERCISSLAARVGKLQALESLRISGIAFHDSDAEALAAALKDLPLLNELWIPNAELGEKGGQSIGSLVALRRILNLDLSRNMLRDKWVSEMVDAILSSHQRSSCALEVLDLGENEIGPAGGEKLKELIRHSPYLQTLILWSNPLGDMFHPQPNAAVAQFPLEKLGIGFCNLGLGGIESMLGAFPALSEIDIGHNDAGDPGAHAVAQYTIVSGWRRLKKLKMFGNNVTVAGARELAKAFLKAYKLQEIDLVGNPIGPGGAAAVMDALATASTEPMISLEFSGCGIEDVGAKAVGRLITRRDCWSVFLDGNCIYAEGARAIADSVAASAYIMQKLDVSSNPLGDEGVRYLLDSILAARPSQSRGVRELDITKTNMGLKGAMAVGRAVMETQGVLSVLNVSEESGDKVIDKIVGQLEMLERDLKPWGTPILSLL
ncbi:MAG: hypothetical protein P4L50_08315 [Anaerolineaceae bacterium]|nr:hypothetical protein [Anaerolineaceae bacterium]